MATPTAQPSMILDGSMMTFSVSTLVQNYPSAIRKNIDVLHTYLTYTALEQNLLQTRDFLLIRFERGQ